ncbi:MAG TPA: DUF5069 domain-containing protein [Opitutales bacterium]|jgi:hypothetical protein|nr:DUF5069 domain-containing protein [Opitutales bacterium]
MSSESKPARPDTGGILYDLPSPYLPHPAFGLLHLPRFIAKARKHLAGQLPPSYQRNFTKGFDGFLCLHLGVDPQMVVAAVREAKDEEDLTARLRAFFPANTNAAKWNRQVVQMGMSEMGREALAATKKKMAIEHREDLRSFADLIEYDEERLA